MNSKDRFLLKNCQIVSRESEGEKDIYVEKGIISCIGNGLKPGDDIDTYDMKGYYLLPGLCDIHVHLREPGREDKETILTGSMAAVKGGITDIACMPNTSPVNDNATITRYIYDKAKDAFCNIYPIGAITKGSKGKEISEMNDLSNAGVVAYSDDGVSVMDSNVLRKAMEYSKIFGKPIISHCEDMSLSLDGVINEGRISLKTNLKGIPSVAEDIIVYRDVALAEYLGIHLHIAHVSTEKSMNIISDAKSRGSKITSEVTPHHIALTEDELLSLNTSAKINPPLRHRNDVEKLKEGLKSGVIDVIASDHAPHTTAEKELNISTDVPSGTIGLETMVPVVLTELYHRGLMTLREIVNKMCYNPCRIIGIEPPAIEEGALARFTLIDTEAEQVIQKDFFLSKSRNSVFIGKKLKGRVLMTVVNGKICYFEDKIVY